MEVRLRPDPEGAGDEAARVLAAAAQEAVARRGRFLVALSGGRTPEPMLRRLAQLPLPWPKIQVFQVDDRQAPLGHPERNLTQLSALLVSAGPLPAANLQAMPLELPDLDEAARRYAQTLERLAGRPPILDLVHLGLGADGHTASLLPGHPVLAVMDQTVAATGVYQGYRRLTLTYPVLNAARTILWLVTGADKAPALARLAAGEASQPAGRIRRDGALIVADAAAARLLPANPAASEAAGRPRG